MFNGLKLRILTLALIFICPKAFAGTDLFLKQLHSYCERQKQDCQCSVRSSPITDTQDYSIISSACVLYYASNRCDEAKRGLREGERGDIISCDREKICDGQANNSNSHCELDGFTIKNIGTSFGVGTVAGVASYFAGAAGGALVGFPLLIYSASKTEEQCARDIKFKKMAMTLHNLSLLSDENPVDFNGKDKALLNLPCSELEKHLRTRETIIVEKRMDRQKWSLDKPKAQSPVGELLLSSYGKCISEKARQRRYCSMISSTIVGAL